MCNEITFENIDTSFVIEFNASLFLSYKIFTVVLLAFCPQYIIYTRVRNIFWDMVGERKRERERFINDLPFSSFAVASLFSATILSHI